MNIFGNSGKPRMTIMDDEFHSYFLCVYGALKICVVYASDVNALCVCVPVYASDLNALCVCVCVYV